MHGCTLVDVNDEPIRPALLWNDQRSSKQCVALEQQFDTATWRQRFGKPPMAGLTLPSLCWVRDNEPANFKQATGLLLPKDFLRLKLTGDRATDVGDASGTLLLDLITRDWCMATCGALNLDPTILPSVHESHVITGTVHRAASKATGLAEGTPVIAGGGDQQTGALACGRTKPGSVSLNLGTSGVLFGACDAPPKDCPQGLHAFCHAVPDMWHVMGVMLSAGGALQWWRTISGASYETLTAEAANTPAGANGVVFKPYLSGERTPHEDANLTAAFHGLSLHHDRADLTRAVFEGIAFGLRDGFDLVTANNPTKHLRFTGGASSHTFWQQLIADAMDCTVATVNIDDGSAFGAAMLACVGAGGYDNAHVAADSIVNETSQTHPNAGNLHDALSQWQSIPTSTAR
jgi:xylulokinase